MAHKDYYKILGIGKDASGDDIKQAYRRMARKYHPDISDEPNAEDQFKDVNEAYETLSAPEKRQKYDLSTPAPQPAGKQHTRTPYKREALDIAYFEKISQQDLGEHDNKLNSLLGSLLGKKKAKQEASPKPAPPYHDPVLILTVEDLFQDTVKTVHTPDGNKIQVRIPKGATEGKKIRLPGKGIAGADLSVPIKIAPHPHYRLEAPDLYMDLPVAPWEAVLGANVTVPTPAGNINLKIPPNSQTGKQMRLPGRGIPSPTGETGDLYIVLHIHAPPATSHAQQAFYQQMEHLFAWTPRNDKTN